MYLGCEQNSTLLATTVTNAYVTAAGRIFRQARGIPMGVDYSPNACNVYFMKYECQAVMRMSRLAPDPELQRQLLSEWWYCFCLMDDMRFVNAPYLAGFLREPVGTGDDNQLGWIYPGCVGIDITYDVTAAGSHRCRTHST